MSHHLPARPTGAALTPKEMSELRRARNMAREEAKRAAKAAKKYAAPPVIQGECEIMDSSRPPAPVAYRGESVPARAYWWVRDNWDQGAPFFTSGGLAASGAVTYLADLPVGQVGMAGAVAAVAASAMAQLKLRGVEHEADRWWVRIGSAASAGWLALASQLGPMNLWSLGTLAVGGVLCGRQWYRYKAATRQVEAVTIEVVPEEVAQPDPAQVMREHWTTQWATVSEQIPDCKGSKVVDVAENSPGNIALKVKLVPIKQHADKVVNAARSLETGLLTQDGKHLRPGALKVVADKTDSTMVKVLIRVNNPLKKVLTFEEVADLLPKSVNEPLLMGRREDTTWDRQKLAGTHWLIGADTGGGKSNLIHTIMANLAGCDDVVIWGADRKGGRALGPWLPRIDWLATNQAEIDLQLRSLEQILTYRETLDLESDQITARPELPALVYIVDEGAEITGTRAGADGTANAARLERIASLGRALGIWIVYATQYCSLESLQSAILREQLKVRFLLSTNSRLAASFVLGDDAWSMIRLSDLSEPGMYYRRTGETQPLTARTPLMTPGKSNDLPKRLAVRGSRIMPMLDAGSVSAAVAEYASRQSRLAPNLVKTFLGGSARQGVPAGASFRQETLPAGAPVWGTGPVAGGGYSAAAGGGTGGVVEGGTEGGTGVAPVGVPGGGAGAYTAGAPERGPADAAREAFDRIWGGVTTGPNVVRLDEVAARRAAAAVDLDAVYGEAEIAMARAIVSAGPDGATRKRLMETTRMGHDWVSTRGNGLAKRGLCVCPRTGQYAPAGPQVTFEGLLAGLKEIDEELREVRRQARQAARSSS